MMIAGFGAHSYSRSIPAGARGELPHCPKFQVRRTQGNAGLVWSEADIAEVFRYLKKTMYCYAPLR